MEHRAFELDNRSFVWVLLRKFKCQLESACSHSASSLPNNRLHNEQGLSSSKLLRTTSVPWSVIRAKNHSIPEHYTIVFGRAIHALRRVILKPFEIPHQPLHTHTFRDDFNVVVAHYTSETAPTFRAGVDILRESPNPRYSAASCAEVDQRCYSSLRTH